MKTSLQDRIARAMEKKRAELISQPLARIWGDLALAAIQEMTEPAHREPTSAFKVMADHFIEMGKLHSQS